MNKEERNARQRQYYWDNREARLAYWRGVRSREAVRARTRYLEGKAYLDAIKLERGCIDCGYNANAGALEFDHVDPRTKTHRLSNMKNYKRSRLDAEIAKCEVRCANCHAIRSHAEEHWRMRYPVDDDPAPPPLTLFD